MRVAPSEGGGAEVEVGVAGVTALEAAPGLEELDLRGLAGRHAGDVEELELADVVPGEADSVPAIWLRKGVPSGTPAACANSSWKEARWRKRPEFWKTA